MAQLLPVAPIIARLLDSLPIPAFVIDMEHKVLYWNTAIEVISGIKREKITGTNEIWRAFYDKKRPTLADLLVDAATLAEGKSYYSENIEISRRIEGALEAENLVRDISGNGRWLHFTASPIKDDSGVLIGAVETLEDISKRKNAEDALNESEKSYRALFESAYDAIWVHDMEGTILTANHSISELCGYPVQEMIGMNVKDFIIGENDVDTAREVKLKLMSGGRIDAPYEMTLIRKDGSRLFTIVTTNLVNVGNDTRAFQNTARDVTSEKRMEENLHYYLQQITRAQEEERKRIARELHDDTAQVLLSLSRQIDNFIRNDPEITGSHHAFLKRIKEQVNQGVQSVHRYSQDLRPSLIDDLGLIPALRSYLKRAREYDNMIVTFEIIGEERRLPSEVELLLYRVIQEALNNVRKHAGATETRLDIHYDDKKVRIIISDNGKGFSYSKTMDNLAQTGKLGLIGMQERTGLLGGTLDFDSTPGKGTRVIVTLPY